jgi:hypothetical protein
VDRGEDTDGDGIFDNLDKDDDNDGVNDGQDAFPLDRTESVDTDGDGIGNNADTDDDGDGVLDVNDDFPLNARETVDTDGDAIGNNADLDDDNDGLSDNDEATAGTNPLVVDTDGDDLSDGDEVNRWSTNPLDDDEDDDGLSDLFELVVGTDPSKADTDGDGLSDTAEIGAQAINAYIATIRDGYGDNADPTSIASQPDVEALKATFTSIYLISDPRKADTDGDDLSDGDEVNRWSTNPLDDDEDGDGLSDLFELVVGTDPSKADTDGDGLSDATEIGAQAINSYIATIREGYGDNVDPSSIASQADVEALQTAFEPIYLNSDPREIDTDGGGINDDEEGTNGTNPLDPSDDIKDSDNDGVADDTDNCPAVANADQANLDGDTAGDLCDADIDGDGIANDEDLSPTDPAIGANSFSIWRFGLADHIDGRDLATLYGLDPEVEMIDGANVLTTQLENPIDQSNLLNLIEGTSDNEPRLVFLMNEVPEAGTSGAVELEFSILDVSDEDAGELEVLMQEPDTELTAEEEAARTSEILALLDTQTGDERKISASIKAAWASDGQDLTISVPAGQTQTVSYTRGNTTLTGTFTDVVEDAYVLSAMTGYANYPASLEVRIANFLRGFEDQIPGELTNLFGRQGLYYVTQSISFVDANGVTVNDMASYRDVPFRTMKALVSIEDIAAPEVPANAFDIAVVSPYQMDMNLASGDAEADTPADMMGDANCYALGSDETLGFLGMSIIAPNEPQCAGEGEVEVIELYPLIYGEALEFDFGPGVSLDGAALNAAISGETTDELLPVIQFALAQVANGEGTFRLRVSLVDGEDGHRDEGERELSIEVDVAWAGDGENAQMATQGDLAASFVGSGTTICPAGDGGEPTCSTLIGNAGADILRFDAAGPNYSPSFSVRLVDLFDANVAGANWGESVSVKFDDYFSGSDTYTVLVDLFEINGPSFHYGGMPIRQVEGILTVDNGGSAAP